MEADARQAGFRRHNNHSDYMRFVGVPSRNENSAGHKLHEGQITFRTANGKSYMLKETIAIDIVLGRELRLLKTAPKEL